MEILSAQDSKPSLSEPVSETSPKVFNGDAKASIDDRVQMQSLLSEARNTKLVLEEFDTAIKNGTYQGHQMMAIAKGLSFVSALIGQTKGNIEALQARLKAPAEAKP